MNDLRLRSELFIHFKAGRLARDTIIRLSRRFEKLKRSIGIVLSASGLPKNNTMSEVMSSPLYSLVGKRIKISIKDQRKFIGMFHCVDQECNVIIYETVEIDPQGQSRPLGDFAMIPGDQIEQVECWLTLAELNVAEKKLEKET